jgi:U3 small nucleolar RNA-associated protein 19
MNRPDIKKKRKRDDDRPQTEGHKRRAVPAGNSSSHDIEQLEERIAENPSKNRKDVETLIQTIYLSDSSSKTNLKAAIALCKAFSRLIASGTLTKNGHESEQSHELSGWYVQQHGIYRMALVKLLQSVSASQRLPIVHLCWRVLEQDAELLNNSVWDSDSMFRPLLAAITELPDGTDIRETFVGEYMNACHDCCYHSLAYISYVQPTRDHKYSLL